MAFTTLHKCDVCGLYLRCYYDDDKGVFLCQKHYNQKCSVTVADDCVHICIDREAMAEIYNRNGQKAVAKLIDDVVEYLAPGDEKISTYKFDNPMITLDRGDHVVMTQKVDR